MKGKEEWKEEGSGPRGGNWSFCVLGLNFFVFEEIWCVCRFEKISEIFSGL